MALKLYATAFNQFTFMSSIMTLVLFYLYCFIFIVIKLFGKSQIFDSSMILKLHVLQLIYFCLFSLN